MKKQETEQRQLVWHRLNSSRAEGRVFKLGWDVHRTKVPGGWLVLVIHNTTGSRSTRTPNTSGMEGVYPPKTCAANPPSRCGCNRVPSSDRVAE
jgi:hypothetical protein